MASGMQNGIITRPYKSGSIIYFENDKSEYIYILKTGRVLLTYTKIDTGEEVKENVRPGEFFGVKSALGKYPREETAQTIGETVVLVLSLADFESLVLKNVNVVRKMLRVFSNQLRRIGKDVRTVLGESDILNPDTELFRIGEHYFKAGDLNKASYAFKRYMEYYPDAESSKVAMERIRSIESGGLSSGTGTSESLPGSDDSSDFLMNEGNDDGFGFGEPSALDDIGSLQSGGDSIPSELLGEMDNFISDSDNSIDDFSLDAVFDDKASEIHCQDIFEEGMNHYNMNNYSDALTSFEMIIEKADLSKENDKKILVNAIYYMGLCNMELKKYRESMSYFSDIIKNYPNSNRVKETYFHIGEIFEKVGKNANAIAYYNKVLNIAPNDSVNSKALDKIKVLQKNQG